MFYDFAVTIPAGTTDADPFSQDLNLTAGVIEKVSILFPPGPHGMVKIRLLQGSHQFIPTNPDGYLASDDEALDIDEYYELKAAPYVLTVLGSSPGTTYDHTINIRIGILRPEDVEKTSALTIALKKFLKLIGV